jgi:predicted lipoprotein with Yx(FWY)xxD motif
VGDAGKPLYTFVNDKKRGDVTGDKDNVWRIVKED